MRTHRSALLAPALCVLTFLLACGACLLLPEATVQRWTAEDGPVENLTVFLYIVAAAALVAANAKLPKGLALVLAIAMLAFAARESNWHRDFTGTSMLRVSYYLGSAPLAHKLASLGVLLPVLAAFAWLGWALVAHLRRHGPARTPANFAIATFLVVLVFSKAVDRSVALLVQDFGVAGAADWKTLQLAIEEPLEMMLPVIVLVALAQHLRTRLRLPAFVESEQQSVSAVG